MSFAAAPGTRKGVVLILAAALAAATVHADARNKDTADAATAPTAPATSTTKKPNEINLKRDIVGPYHTDHPLRNRGPCAGIGNGPPSRLRPVPGPHPGWS